MTDLKQKLGFSQIFCVSVCMPGDNVLREEERYIRSQ